MSLNILSVKIIIKFIEYNKRMKVFAVRLLEVKTMKKQSNDTCKESERKLCGSLLLGNEQKLANSTEFSINCGFFDVSVDYLLGRSDY